jgi:hypothetical protein
MTVCLYVCVCYRERERGGGHVGVRRGDVERAPGKREGERERWTISGYSCSGFVAHSLVWEQLSHGINTKDVKWRYHQCSWPVRNGLLGVRGS